MNNSAQCGRKISAFEHWLRTGRRAPVEYKFNGWHDPDDGKFTQVGGGRFFPQGAASPSTSAPRPSKRTDGVPDRSAFDPKDSRNYTIVKVKEGDSLSRIAKQRRGVTVADLAWLNDLDAQKPLQIGQSIKLPNQAFLDDGREARNKFLGLAYYMDTHGGKLPPDPAHPPSISDQIASERLPVRANGYVFSIDPFRRTHVAEGNLTLNQDQQRSRSAQSAAGGSDRRKSDEGGHFIARIFNGPTEAFNHFAQDRTFNRSGYRRLENLLKRAKIEGRNVFVHIEARYEELSQRPFEIKFRYTIDGEREQEVFPNGPRHRDEK